jgi:hypothetical protein
MDLVQNTVFSSLAFFYMEEKVQVPHPNNRGWGRDDDSLSGFFYN